MEVDSCDMGGHEAATYGDPCAEGTALWQLHGTGGVVVWQSNFALLLRVKKKKQSAQSLRICSWKTAQEENCNDHVVWLESTKVRGQLNFLFFPK